MKLPTALRILLAALGLLVLLDLLGVIELGSLIWVVAPFILIVSGVLITTPKESEVGPQ